MHVPYKDAVAYTAYDKHSVNICVHTCCMFGYLAAAKWLGVRFGCTFLVSELVAVAVVCSQVVHAYTCV